MLKNTPALAIRGVDTAENEPSKVSMKWESQTGVSPVIREVETTPNVCRLTFGDRAIWYAHAPVLLAVHA